MSAGLYLLIPLVIILAIGQATVLPAFPVFGIVPGLWLVVTLAWSLLRGMREGLILAFAGGFFIDLLSAAPLGATSLALMLTIAIITFFQRHLPRNQTIIPALLMVLATVIFWIFYLLLLRVIMPFIIGSQDFLGIADLRVGGGRNSVLSDIGSGYSMNAPLLRLIVRTAAIHGLLMIPLYWLINVLQRAYGRRRVEL